MKVYIAERGYDYEGFVIIGVFSTREKAQEACNTDTFGDGTERGDYHNVEEFEMND